MEFLTANNKQFSASAEYCSCFDLSLSGALSVERLVCISSRQCICSCCHNFANELVVNIRQRVYSLRLDLSVFEAAAT